MKILSLYLLFVLLSGAVKPTATLKVEITNITNKKGDLRIGVYQPGEKFGGTLPGISKVIEVKSNGTQVASFDLEPGKYALAIYHDLNKNQTLDKNFVGIPKEPYGFSNNFRPKFSAPSFEDCEVELLPSGKSISVKLSN